MQHDQNNQDHELSSKEQHELKREQKLKEEGRVKQARVLRRAINMIAVVLVIGGFIGGLVWYVANLPQTPESEILSNKGLHWHPRVSIVLKGQAQEIPNGLGLGAVHNPIHTHDASGVIHLEFQGIVRKDQLTLGRFFELWGKPFNANCIFEYCNDGDGKVTMTVNGQENTEFENYQMRDADQIEIRYE